MNPLSSSWRSLISAASTAAISFSCFHFWRRWRQGRGESSFTHKYIESGLFFSNTNRRVGCSFSFFIPLSRCQTEARNREQKRFCCRMSPSVFANEQIGLIRKTFFADAVDSEFYQERNLLLQAIAFQPPT